MTLFARRPGNAGSGKDLQSTGKEKKKLPKYRNAVWLLFFAAVLAFAAGCSKQEARHETVATVNGEEIKVAELRELLGSRVGLVSLPGVPVEKKKQALDRLIAGRLLAQEARSRGLDNSEEFRTLVSGNEKGIWINALLRQEIANRVKIDDSVVKDEAKKLRVADNALTVVEAQTRAGQAVTERELRKVEEDLVRAAKKDVPASIDMETIGKIGKGTTIAEDTVLATVGGERITYGQVRKILQSAAPGPHGPTGLLENPVAVQRVVDREAMGAALYAYAKKKGLEGGEALKKVRTEVERAALIDLLAGSVIGKSVSVTEKEIEAAYAEHGQMFVRDGKKIPISQVRDQLRAFLENAKRRRALDEYAETLRKKGKVTVDESVLPRV